MVTDFLSKAMINMKTSIKGLIRGKYLGKLVEIEGDTKKTTREEEVQDISCIKGVQSQF